MLNGLPAGEYRRAVTLPLIDNDNDYHYLSAYLCQSFFRIGLYSPAAGEAEAPAQRPPTAKAIRGLSDIVCLPPEKLEPILQDEDRKQELGQVTLKLAD